MAPEVLLGGEAGARSDVYSIGCMAFWLLTGDQVFGEGPAMQVAVRHISDPPPPPSQVPGCDCPAELEALVLACLAKEPADRPADAGVVGERLAAIQPSSPWTNALARDWWRARVPAEPSPADAYSDTLPMDTGAPEGAPVDPAEHPIG